MTTLLDAEALAATFGLNAESVRRLTRGGFIPCHRIGNSVRYDLDDVLRCTRVGIHPDDEAVDKFAEAMHGKMAHARAQGAEGWDDPEGCPVGKLATLLVNAVAKGDPVDVGNYAMMLHARGAAPDVLAQAFAVAVREFQL